MINGKKITVNNEGTILQIKVSANSSKNEIEELDEFFKVKIKAPAVDNKANQELIKFLSEHFNTAKSDVTILHGAKSSRKTVLIKNFFITDKN